MKRSPFAHIPLNPPGIPEWEELLVRLEVGPRAVRVAVEGVPADDGATGARARVGEELAHLAQREEDASEWLRRMREGAQLPSWGGGAYRAAGAETGSSGLEQDLRRYSERRARSFAGVQRRGLEVWRWQAKHAEFGSVSAFQLLSYLTLHDGRHLAVIRSTLRGDG